MLWFMQNSLRNSVDFCYGSCFEVWICPNIIGIFGNHLSIVQSLLLLTWDFMWRNTRESPHCTHTEIYKMHTSAHLQLRPAKNQTTKNLLLAISLHRICYEPNSYPSGITTSHSISKPKEITFLPWLKNNRSYNPPDTHCHKQTWSTFQDKGHCYCSIYVFLSYLTYVKLYCCVH